MVERLAENSSVIGSYIIVIQAGSRDSEAMTIRQSHSAIIGMGHGFGTSKSLHIFYTRKSLISRWRGTVEVLPTERLMYRL
jgi:hypothetical protein